jgi:hypothetical protein
MGRHMTNISPRLGVSGVIALSRVVLVDAGILIWNVAMEAVFNHAGGHVGAELLDLLANNLHEIVTGPPPQHHNGVNWDFPQVHGME